MNGNYIHAARDSLEGIQALELSMSFSPSPGCQDTKLIEGNPGQDETLRGTQKYLPEEKKKQQLRVQGHVHFISTK